MKTKNLTVACGLIALLPFFFILGCENDTAKDFTEVGVDRNGIADITIGRIIDSAFQDNVEVYAVLTSRTSMDVIVQNYAFSSAEVSYTVVISTGIPWNTVTRTYVISPGGYRKDSLSLPNTSGVDVTVRINSVRR